MYMHRHVCALSTTTNFRHYFLDYKNTSSPTKNLKQIIKASKLKSIIINYFKQETLRKHYNERHLLSDLFLLLKSSLLLLDKRGDLCLLFLLQIHLKTGTQLNKLTK